MTLHRRRQWTAHQERESCAWPRTSQHRKRSSIAGKMRAHHVANGLIVQQRAVRRLIPSTNTARRTLAYSSTVFMPPVSHRKHVHYRRRTCLGTPKRTCLSVKLQSGGWSTFTPPRHAANAASRGLFLLRRVQLASASRKSTFPTRALEVIGHLQQSTGGYLTL